MTRPSTSKLILLIFFVASLVTAPARTAPDEGASLALLVRTLNGTENDLVQVALLNGMLAGLAGGRDITPPEGWSELSPKLAKSQNKTVRELTDQLSQLFGDKEVTRRALAMIGDRSAATAARRKWLHSLLTQKNDQVSALLEPLLGEPELRRDAIRGFAAIENLQAPKILLSHYREWPAADQQAIIETLATRKVYAEALLAALKANVLRPTDVPAHTARSLSIMLGDDFSKVYGDVRPLAEDRTKLIAKYKKLLTIDAIEKADSSKGRAIFKKTCAACHALYGDGGEIGPDLTGSNRANLDYILLNSVDPSYDVPAGYKMVTIQTVDGRVLNGVVAQEDAQRIVLKTVEQPEVVVLKSDIDVRQISSKSMMPDGQLEKMTRDDMKNLIKYLRTTEQVEISQ
jgi:putative heme-binding domain-containing protein